MKTQINTLAYFDVNQKNGGAIFAKNLHIYLNDLKLFESQVYCPYRASIASDMKETNKGNSLSYIILFKLKKWLIGFEFIELFVHFLRNDLNAFLLVARLYFNGKFEKKSIFLFHDHLTLFYFSLFFSIKNRNVVLVMHNDGSPEEMVSSGINKKWKRNILDKITNFQIKCTIRNISRFIFLCDKAKNKFISKYGIESDTASVIHNGLKQITTNFSTLEEKSKIKFITVCTMNERKGIDIFIKCLPKINQSFQDKIHFTMIGQGPLLEKLKQLSSIYSNLDVIGESANVNDYLLNSDVFFLLSRTEGQPLSIVEALRSSLFVIATDVGCNESMVNVSNGLLVELKEEAIIDAFSKTITNWNLLKLRGLNSVKLFNEKFTEEKMYESYIKIFNSFL